MKYSHRAPAREACELVPRAFRYNRSIAFDIDVYPNRWCAAFLWENKGGTPRTRVVETVADLQKQLRWVARHDATLVGFNSRNYDEPILRAVLGGHDPYAFSSTQIEDNLRPWETARALGYDLRDLPALGVDHIDLFWLAQKGNKRPSLKQAAANMGRSRIVGLPHDPHLPLDEQQWAEVVAYCLHDLEHTRALARHYEAELLARVALSREYGLDLRSLARSAVAQRVFERAYAARHGTPPGLPEKPTTFRYDAPVDVVPPRTPEARAWYDAIVGVEHPIRIVTLADGSERRSLEGPKASVDLGTVLANIGVGGIHSADRDRNTLYRADADTAIWQVDVASYYPSLALNHGLFPAAFGTAGREAYAAILKERLALKARIRVAKGAEKARLQRRSDGLKLVLNSATGQFNNHLSSLYDPNAYVAVTLSGQLLMIELVELLQAVDVEALSLNTDGLIVRVPRADGRWKVACRDWGLRHALTLERDELAAVLITSTNRVATRSVAGRENRVGSGLLGTLDPTTELDMPIVADAVVAAVFDDVPPEVTIRACRDLNRFLKVRKGDLRLERSGVEPEGLPRVVRWYVGRGSDSRITYRVHDSRTGGWRWDRVGRSARAVLVGELPDSLPRDLDLGFYVQEARQAITKIKGCAHLNPDLVGDHPLARRLVDMGFVPMPKWGGKNSPRGASYAAPTLLWDWNDRRIDAVGVYTGPATGILVVDIDAAPKWNKAALGAGAPRYRDRVASLAGTLVALHGDVSAADVRRGLGRGKLIFKFEAGPDHPLARLAANKWGASRGVDVFYGKGAPTVLGRHPGGEEYRLEGELAQAPEWLVEFLTPKSGDRSVLTASRHAVCDDDETLELARDVLLEVAPADMADVVAAATTTWRPKQLNNGARALVGRCPYAHREPGAGEFMVLATDEPPHVRVRCQHATCEAQDRLRAAVAAVDWGEPAVDPEPDPDPPPRPPQPQPATESDGWLRCPEVHPSSLNHVGWALLADLGAPAVSIHRAPTGSGKSFQAAIVAVERARQGERTVLAVPTIRNGREMVGWILQRAPDLLQDGRVAQVFALHRGGTDGDDDELDDADADDARGRYPIDDRTMIVVCTHSQLLRRGFSRSLRGFWDAIETGSDEGGEGPTRPFAVIVDEASELLYRMKVEVPLGYRYTTRSRPDGRASLRVPLSACPKTSRSGNCGNCRHDCLSGRVEFNRFAIPELRPPKMVALSSEGRELEKVVAPVHVEHDDFELGASVRVGRTTFAAQVLGYRGRATRPGTRATAPIHPFRRDPRTGRQPPDDPVEVLEHMLEFSRRPLLIWESAIDAATNEPVEDDELRRRMTAGTRGWDDTIVFPHSPCGVPRLQFADSIGLERLRRFARDRHAGVAFLGATLSPDDIDTLRESWPDLVERRHPYGDRKIRQVAILAVDEPMKPSRLVEGGQLATAPLERHGLGLVFTAYREQAESLYAKICDTHPSVCLALGNDEVTTSRRSLHRRADTPLGCYISYSRGVLGVGANIANLRFVVVDALAFRSLAGFTPSEITPEEFAALQAAERTALLIQNLGRALRGEAGKTATLIVLNADRELIEALATSEAIVEGCELPPVLGRGSLTQVVAMADGWLEAGGGALPAPPDEPQSRGRRGGNPGISMEVLMERARAAGSGSGSWRDFRRSQHLDRRTDDEYARIKSAFESERALRPLGTGGG